MRHNRDDKRLGRTSGHLRCMMANMTNSLILAGRIKTTTPKAKLLRRYAERMVTLGKKGTLASRRRAMAFMRNKKAVTRLFAEVAPNYSDRPGGYTRIIKVGNRPGDCAPVSIIELVEAGTKKKTPAKKSASRKAAAKKASGKGASKKAPVKEKAARETAEKKASEKAPAKKAAPGKTAAEKAQAKKTEKEK